MRMRTLLGYASLAALVLLGGIAATPAQAQRWEDCRERIHHAEGRLDRAVYRFGRHSDAARDARHDLERIRDWCMRHNRDRGRHDRRDRDRY